MFGGSPGSMKKKKVLSKVVPFAHLIIYSYFVVILLRHSEKSMNKKEKITELKS